MRNAANATDCGVAWPDGLEARSGMKRIVQVGATPASRIVIVAVLPTALLWVGFTAAIKGAGAQANTGCTLNSATGAIKHMIYLQCGNTHYNCDNPSVALDPQQMPLLLNFLTQNGTLFTNDHTNLISHTAGGIVSSLTGLYPDRNGQTVSNSYDYYKANGIPVFTSSTCWTDTQDGTDDPLPNMAGDNQQTPPAPWLIFTHAGCNGGGVWAANIELENNLTTPSGDLTRVFDLGSPEWNEANNPATRAQATTNCIGIAIHCVLGASLCDTPNARTDDATIVPGSCDGYDALFGAKYVNPAITGGQQCVNATTCVIPVFAWNHGDVQREIGNTWVGIVGPGVQNNGIDATTWTAHTNLRPMILALLGLKDSYVVDGRVLIEALDTKASPHALVAHRETARQLGDVYEQVNTPFGQFALDTLMASTKLLASNDTGDATYTSIEGQIQTRTSQRDALASQIRSALNVTAFDGQALDEQQAKGWIEQVNDLLSQAHTLAAMEFSRVTGTCIKYSRRRLAPERGSPAPRPDERRVITWTCACRRWPSGSAL
jgi:hypothetical protein